MMTQTHTLFVCKSCKLAESEEGDRVSVGSQLLNDLLEHYQNWSRQSELTIQPVGCLWTCNRPCTVSLTAPNKATYLFMGLPIAESAAALLQFSELYLDSSDGDILWSKFPEVLKSGEIGRVPPIELQNEI
jgi:predicted metal-binding protein